MYRDHAPRPRRGNDNSRDNLLVKGMLGFGFWRGKIDTYKKKYSKWRESPKKSMKTRGRDYVALRVGLFGSHIGIIKCVQNSKARNGCITRGIVQVTANMTNCVALHRALFHTPCQLHNANTQRYFQWHFLGNDLDSCLYINHYI